MKKAIFLFLVVLFVACKETPETIIQKNIEMRGGKSNFDRVKNLFMVLNINSMGMELPVTIYIVRPSTMRTEVNFAGQQLVTILLPDTAIALLDNNVTPLPAQAITEMRQNLNNQLNYLRSELMNYSELGGKLETVSKEKFKGKDAHKFKIAYPDGSISYIFVDRSSYLNLGARTEKMVDGQKLETETIYSDYRKTEGLMIPFKTEVYNGKNLIARVTIDTIAINKPIPTNLFSW